jgi:hypothetical protein
MRYFNQIRHFVIADNFAIRVLVMLVLLLSPVTVWAAKGPCTVTTSTSFSNTIHCDSGVCLGKVHTVPEQSACDDVNEVSCSSASAYLSVDYEPKSVHYTAAELGAHFGVGLVCASCVLGIVAVTGATGPGAIAAITLACGGACAAAFAGMDGCWFVRCEQDLTTKTTVSGGASCN